MKNEEIKLKRGADPCELVSSFFILSFFLHLLFRPRRPIGFRCAPPTRSTPVVIVENSDAVSDFQPNAAIVQDMVNRGLTTFTGKATIAGAWRSLVTTQDVVGIKVCSEPGEISGTRPAVAAA